MNRDAMLATIIGFILGLIITSIVIAWPTISTAFKSMPLKIPQLSQPTGPDTSPARIQPKDNQQESNSEPLTIKGPVAGTIVETDTLLVSGIAPIRSLVIIGGPLDETVAIPSDDGTYSGSISLQEGKNSIDVSALIDGALSTKTVEVFYVQK